jgi:predicted Zn-dependent protease
MKERYMMLDQDEARSILDKVMAISAADETEAHLSSHRSSLTRFAENHIHQNVSEEDVRLSVTAVLGKRMGDASTNKLDDESIKKVVADAIEVARFAPPDDELLPRLGPQIYREVQAYDSSIDGFTPMDRARAVAEAVKLCEENGLKAAGAFSDRSGSGAMSTSNGLFAFHQNSGIDFSITAQGDDSTGWAGGSSHRMSEVEPRSLGEIAVEKALKGREPKEIPPGRYTVILEPAAVGVIAFMFSGFNALAVDEGRSFLTGRMGQRILGDGITLVSDPYHALHQGRPFDGDGLPTKRVVLVENGVAANLVYDRLTAKKHGVEPTGHGGGGRNAYGAYPSHIVMEGGETTIEDMIASTDRGILVTRFWYMRVVDPMKVIITGMTRDGTFWIENGKIAYGMKNFRFNQSVLDMLNNVEMMSKPTLAGGMVVPAVKVREFNFTSGTDAI